MVRESALQQAKHAEIARRYSKRRPRPTMATLRVRDLTVLAKGRFGLVLPDTQPGRSFANVMAHHLAALPGDPRKRISPWLRSWCPWLPLIDAETLLVECLTRPQRWSADKLAWRLRLLAADRTALRITTIGSIDESREQRAKRRKALDKARKATARKAKGTISRAQYLAKSISRAKPWQSLGMSRAAWYRAGKPTA